MVELEHPTELIVDKSLSDHLMFACATVIFSGANT